MTLKLFARYGHEKLLIVLVGALSAFASVRLGGFATHANVDDLALSTAILALASVGQMVVVVGGGLDLSIPLVMTGTAMLTSAILHGDGRLGLPGAIVISLVAAALVGLINGLGVTVLHVTPIIMTLATQAALAGAIALELQGKTSTVGGLGSLASWANSGVGPVPWTLVTLVVLVVVGSWATSRTVFGRELFAVGTNEVAAKIAGLSSQRLRTSSYVVSALLAGMAGLLLLGFSGQATSDMGSPYLFSSVAAVVIGGTSIRGGRGTVVGVVAGALLLTLVQSILTLSGATGGNLKILYGAAILVSAWFASQSTGWWSAERGGGWQRGSSQRDGKAKSQPEHVSEGVS